MDHWTLLEFQVNRLGYQFKNVDLLREALTHSLDTAFYRSNSEFHSQNRRYDRLQVMGNPVIKFVISQYVVQICDVSASEGQLAQEKDQLINGTVQTKVGKKLLQSTSPGRGHYEFIRVDSASKLNFDQLAPGAQIPYKNFVRALMGAVYLDAGGVAGDGIEMATKVFVRIWGDLLKKETETKSLQVSFPAPSEEIQTFWEKNEINAGFIAQVEESIGVSITPGNGHLLAGALIQQTFYDDSLEKNGISRDQYLPDYQRFEFLGDSVLSLIVTELVWLEEDPYYTTNGLDEKVRQRIESKGLMRVYYKLKLRNFVKMKAGGIAGWNGVDDIVESIVGAIFVNGGGHAAMNFITTAFVDFNVNPASEPNLQDLEDKLGYKFHNAQFLIRALTHPSVQLNPALKCEQADNPSILTDARLALTYFGKAWIKFHASDYVLRSCCPEDTQATLESRREYLCSQSVLQRIGSNLQLSLYFRVTNGQMRSGTEPFMVYEDMVHTICGAIFKDMQEAKIKMSFGKVFYRLWNSFFGKKIPAKQLLDNFPQNCRNSLRGHKLEKIEEKMHHSFSFPWLLGEALTTNIFRRVGSSRSLGDSVKFLFIGEALLDLAVSVYVAILWFMELQAIRAIQPNTGYQQLQALHSITTADCIAFGNQLFQPESLREHLLFPPGLDQRARSSVPDAEIIKCLLAAVYFDQSVANVDESFSRWKDYFMTTCKFITGNQNREG